MFKRIRHLRISLAAKCQLLFGAAVVLIVAAALFVPWQRMEQLMRQLDEASAETLAEAVMLAHVEGRQGLLEADDKGRVIEPLPGVRLYRVRPDDGEAAVDEEDGNGLPRFERGALARFQQTTAIQSHFRHYEWPDGSSRFRYARPLYMTQTCLACHQGDGGLPILEDLPEEETAEDAVREALAATDAPRRVPELMGLISVDMPSQIDTPQLLLNRIVIVVAGILAGTLAIIVFYVITTRLILQPVRVLQETAEKVSEGDLNIRSDISTGDEFQQLSETFNTMLANLKKSGDQLRSINRSLDLKIGQLSESNVALYESNRLKSEFLANVSHELRTPLNSILGFAQLLQDSIGAPPDARTSRYLNNILNSGQNLLDLINDLLDLAKIEAGKMEVRSEPLSLSDLFEGLIGILKPLTEEKQLTIAASVAREVPILRTDPAKLQQILYNFLSNAIKYSPAGEVIDLAAERMADGSIRISVTDRGPGIEPEKQPMIFEKFRQIDGSVTRAHGGSGLGLAISRELAALMNGSIGLRSTPGHGSTFWVILPPKIEARTHDVREGLVLTKT
jgi:two-component system, NarL family, sensor histidine kinase BarA